MTRLIAALLVLLPVAAMAQQSDVQRVLDLNSGAFQGEYPMVVGTIYTDPRGGSSGPYLLPRSLKATCTAAGNVSVLYPDQSVGVWAVVVGVQTIPVAAVSINTSGTTGTCTYAGLK